MEKNKNINSLIGDLYKKNGLLSKNNNIEKHIDNINKDYITNQFNDDYVDMFNDTPKRSYFFYYFLWTIFIVFLVVGFVLLFYFRNSIHKYFKSLFVNKEIQDELKEIKELKKSIKQEQKQQEKQQQEKKEKKEKKVPKKNIKVLEDNISNKIRYSKNKYADYDGFCYIGYDKGQRECTEIEKGDVCLSGEIFPSQEICMVPTLRP